MIWGLPKIGEAYSYHQLIYTSRINRSVSKSKRDKLNYLDIIAEDKKLIEGYVAIIKEMAIKYGVA